MRRRILLVFGTRPEAIKMAPVYHELRSRPETFETICCVTGQHRELLDQMLDVFGMVPDIDLGLMRTGNSLADTASDLLAGVGRMIADVAPDMVLVHGDTLTASAAAQAAFLARVPVGHVEAGLRTGDLAAPFPEEANRRIADLLSSLHFAPTETNRTALLAEGIPADRITVTGNTVVDALHQIEARLERQARLHELAASALDAVLGFDWRCERFVLLTGHRRENFGAGLAAVCRAISDLALSRPGLHFVYPVHPNPAVASSVAQRLSGLRNVHLVSPLDYAAFVLAMKHCHLVLTDSGGIQEEAPALGKPVLVMRDVTERPEAVASGTVRLVGTDAERIVAEVGALLDDPAAHASMARAHSPYGDGHAAVRIADRIEAFAWPTMEPEEALSLSEAVR